MFSNGAPPPEAIRCCPNGNSTSVLPSTSIETQALALLSYDPRVRTSWFPRGRSGSGASRNPDPA